jgi:hypothetical protein
VRSRWRLVGFFAGLNVLPKTWHLTTYSYRTSRSQQLAFFEALQPRLREAGLIGEQGLNLDFHAIMSYGEQETVLEKHYVPRRSQRTRSVLTFIAQDGQEHDHLRQRRAHQPPTARRGHRILPLL